MAAILVIVGAVLGALSLHFFGFVIGALLGYLLANMLAMREQISALKLDVKLLMAKLAEKNSAPTFSTTPQNLTPSSQSAQQSADTVNAPVEPHSGVLLPHMEPVVQLKPQSLTAHASVTATPQSTASRTANRPSDQAPYRNARSTPVDEPAIVRYLRAYFSGPQLLARVGIIVLFFGVAFLLKYAAERSQLSIEVRLMGVAIGAMTMLVIGWRLRRKYEDYALVMQGGAIGVLYLTVFSAMRLFSVLPAAYALMILAATGIFSAILAVVQNARSLAILGICGGFLAPILTSTGAGSHIVLFSYYALLNAGIFGMAWFKAWRPLNLLGFIFTFVIATIWGVTRYQAEDFASSESFLILFFLFYVSIAVLYAHRQNPQLNNYVDGTLVFGTPIIAFGLQAGMMQQAEVLQNVEYGLAGSAVVLSLFYLSLGKILFEHKRDSLRLLVESFLALGLVFATLAIPLALDARWTSASWALEGAAVLWMGTRQHRLLPRLFGALLQIAAGITLLTDFQYHANSLPILNSIYIGGVLVSLAALFSAWYMQRNESKLHPYERYLVHLLFSWGVLWWFAAGLREIDQQLSAPTFMSAALVYVAFSSAAFSLLHIRLIWPAASIPALGLLPFMLLIALVQWTTLTHPFAELGAYAWLLAFVIMYWIVRRHESSHVENENSGTLIRIYHLCILWLLAFILSRETAWEINHFVQGLGTWPLIAWALIPGLLLAGISTFGQRIRWPIAAHLETYLVFAALPLASFLWLWSIFSNLSSDGNPYPLSYLPLLNPLDLAQLFVFIVLATWLFKLKQLALPVFDNYSARVRYGLITGTLFLWLNAVLLRTLHYWADVPYTLHSMMHSVLVQASLSIFWSVLALALMRYAAQRLNRPVWMAGGALMAAVVLKLFTVDISGIGSLERIISFIGVAVFMLIIGYIAPLPAKEKEEESHA
jgi:uncharacterized membrane protein